MAADFDEFFDDEMAEAESVREYGFEPASAPDLASGSVVEEDGRPPSAESAASADSDSPHPRRQSPPFWMVLAIAGVSLLLGAVIGYLVGTTVTINELVTHESQPGAPKDASVEMPEGHPDIEFDEDGNAKVADGPAPVSNDPLTLANNFFDMGMSAMNGAKSEEDRQKARDVFRQAIVHYDEYLEDNATPSAEVDRAICVFYAGEHERAIADLEAFVERDATFAPAWANLGMFYESHGDAGKAERAYRKAVDTASEDDTYGVGDYARDRLEALSK